MPRLLAAALVLSAGVLSLLTAAPAAQAAAAPSLSPSAVYPGGSFTISGTGCWDPGYVPSDGTPEPEWIVGIVSATPGSVRTSAANQGAWSITLTANLPPGRFSLEAFCRLSNSSSFSYPKVWIHVQPPGAPLDAPWAGPPVPGASVAPPPAAEAAPARPVLPRTPAPRTVMPAPRTVTPAPSADHATTPPTAPAADPAPSTAAPPTAPPPAPGPAAGCVDCAALDSGAPLAPGRALSLSYTGFQPGEQVTVVMRSTPVTLGTFEADAAGTVTATLALPDDAEGGGHTLTFSGPSSGDRVVVPFTVAAPEVTGVPRTVRATPEADDGASVLAPALALGALVLGGGLLLHRRRRGARRAAVPAIDAEKPQ